MPYPKYFVAYGAMDHDTDSNIFGHACVLFLSQKTPDAKVEVIDCIGYYGVIPASDTNPFKKSIKLKLGMNIDFIGGYGQYQREDIRFIDRGVGVWGKPYQISEDRFKSFVEMLKEIIQHQDLAIKEAMQSLDIKLADALNQLDTSVALQKELIQRMHDQLSQEELRSYNELLSKLTVHTNLQRLLLNNPTTKISSAQVKQFNSFLTTTSYLIKQLHKKCLLFLNKPHDDPLHQKTLTDFLVILDHQKATIDLIAPIMFKAERKYHSKHIYDAELKRAADDQDAPRLSPFEFRFSIHDDYILPVPSFRSATDCKTKALELLIAAGVDKSQIDELGRGHSKGNIPRFNGDQVPLPLHSIGPKKTVYSKRKKLTYFSSDWDRELGHYDKAHDVTLWMTIPPQDVMSSDSISEDDALTTRNYYNLPKDMKDNIIDSMAAIQRLERIVLHSHECSVDMTAKEHLLLKLRHYTHHAFSHPNLNHNSNYLSQKLAEIRGFLNDIYNALSSDGRLEIKSANTHKMLPITLNLNKKDSAKILKALRFMYPTDQPVDRCHFL